MLPTAFSCLPGAPCVDDLSAERDNGRTGSPGRAHRLRGVKSEPAPRAGDDDVCWICLDPAGAHGPLERPCACPRAVHAMCLARWQLHSAGRDEERVCRFCNTELRDWKPVMTAAAGAKVVTPYMRVSFNGKTYKVQVQPGPEGAAAFEKQIRSLLQLPEGLEFDVIFHCRAPGTGDKLTLQGLPAFDAAVHCASLSTKQAQQAANAAAAGARAKAPRKAPGLLTRLLGALGCRSPGGAGAGAGAAEAAGGSGGAGGAPAAGGEAAGGEAAETTRA